ncbi:MAG: hypothetical protein D4R82_03630 [Dehalococcoidia bacterium]|nr:MAG: hypothetical protein D4R82_03630 [Dehalococcoidia bacterium]
MAKFVWQWSIQILLGLVGLGVNAMPSIQTWIPSIIIWGIAFIWAVISIIFWCRFKKREISNIESIRNIPIETGNILQQIHKRLTELKDKAVDQYLASYQYKDFLELNEEIMDTMGNNIDLGNIREDVKGKKLSKKKREKRLQIDNLFEQVNKVLPTEWALDYLTTFVNKFNRLAVKPNRPYKGLDTLRNKDRKWKRLYNKLQNIKVELGDNGLNKMIDEYIDWSYGGNGLSLITDIVRNIPSEDLPTRYLESEAYGPVITIENKMTKLRTDITNRIKELLSVNLGTQIEEQNEQGDFYFEFNDNSITTKDGRLILGVSYSTAKKMTIETLQLDYNGKRFRPSDWFPIEIKHIHTQNYTFDLNTLRTIADETSQEAVFIAKVDGIECRSHPFNIYKLF